MLQIFIQNFTAITRPLVGLTHKGIPFEWGDAQHAAMICLKDEIIQLTFCHRKGRMASTI